MLLRHTAETVFARSAICSVFVREALAIFSAFQLTPSIRRRNPTPGPSLHQLFSEFFRASRVHHKLCENASRQARLPLSLASYDRSLPALFRPHSTPPHRLLLDKFYPAPQLLASKS